MKIGVVGSSMIAFEFLDAVQNFKNIQVVSICGTKRSRDKLLRLAKSFNIDNIFEDYEKFLKSDIRGVYIAVPNHLHFEMAKRALLAGKSVLLEKPFTLDFKEADELIRIANRSNLVILEAITTLYLPTYKFIQESLKDIGNVKIVAMNFSQYSSKYDRFKAGEIASVFDKDKGGGALMDLNVYNLHFIVGLFKAPLNVIYTPNIEKGVDTSGILTLEYKGFKCTLIAAKDCKAPPSISIQGDEGCLYSQCTPNTLDEVKLLLNNGDETKSTYDNQTNRIFYEIEEFARVLRERDYVAIRRYNENTLTVARIMTKAKTFL